MASKRNLRRRACQAKQPYSMERARRTARAIHDRDGKDVRAYKCQWCGSWHVGHYGAEHVQVNAWSREWER